MLFYMIRHGIPDYATDTLTPEGVKQAEAVAERLALHGIDEVYSSPLGRARQTAEPTCRKLGLSMQIEPLFSEQFAAEHFYWKDGEGAWRWAFWQRENLLGSDENFALTDSFVKDFYADNALAERGYEELGRYTDAFFEKLGYRKEHVGNRYRAVAPNDKKIALFCHQGLGLHLLSYLLNLPPHLVTPLFDISHTGITVFRFDGEETVIPQCLCVSDLSHISMAGLPMKYEGYLDF